MKWNGRFPRGWPKRKSRRRVTKLPCLFVDVTSFRSVKLDRGFLFPFFSFFPFRCRRNRYHFLFSSFSLRPLFSLASFSLFPRLLFPFLFFLLFLFSSFILYFWFLLDLICSLCGDFFSGEKPRFKRVFFFFLNVFCEIIFVNSLFESVYVR